MPLNFGIGKRAGAVDLGVALVGNHFLSTKAAQQGNLRWQWGDPAKKDSVVRDHRFWMTLGGAAVGILGGGNRYVSRAGNAAAHAAGGSLIATEAVAREAKKRLAQQGQGQIQDQGQPSFSPPVEDTTAQRGGGYGLPGAFR